VLSDFKDTVFFLDKPDTIGKDILGLCDRLRDIDLFDLGIYLKDRENLPALVRPVTKELSQLREEKAAKLHQRQLEK
jgi:cysteinyl-tRNA synthetase